jgi:hypothetical protein
VDALAFSAEKAEDLDRLIAGGTERVREPDVPDPGIADLWGGDARTVRCRPLRDFILESSQS